MGRARAVAITIDRGDLATITAVIDRVAAGVVDLSPFLDASRMHMIESITLNFERGGRPQPWAPLSPAYIRMRPERAGGIPLSDTGALKNSTTVGPAFEMARDALTMWAGELHGVFHQHVDIPPDDQWGQRNKRGVPWRPFMLFQSEDIDEIGLILGRYIDDLMKGGG